MSSTGTPDWSLPGITGSVPVTGSTDTTAPHVNVDAPFSVTETQVHTLQAGEGPVVADTAISVNLCELPVLSPPATVRGCGTYTAAPDRGSASTNGAGMTGASWIQGFRPNPSLI